ncbi:MAG: hypothetical protein LBU36_00980 [Clostridiales bacterium]|jgi:hypothetical protein|nr:hypothetical protein [Clostridiales bacterium]
MYKGIFKLASAAFVAAALCVSAYAADAPAAKTVSANPPIAVKPFAVSNYWNNETVDAVNFSKTFKVTDDTHKYGKVFYSNLLGVSGCLKKFRQPEAPSLSKKDVTIRIFKDGQTPEIVNFTVSDVGGDGKTVNGDASFPVSKGDYSISISISNGGSEKLNGILSLKSSSDPF